MYRILRVAPSKCQYRKAFDIIQSFSPSETDFDTFYNATESIYLIENDNNYEGYAYIRYSDCGEHPIHYRVTDSLVHELVLELITNDDKYNKYRDMIRTISRDKMDRCIVLYDVSPDNEDLIRALKVCKYVRTPSEEGFTYCSTKNYDRELTPINPRSYDDTIDAYARLTDGSNNIYEDHSVTNDTSSFNANDFADYMNNNNAKCCNCEYNTRCMYQCKFAK